MQRPIGAQRNRLVEGSYRRLRPHRDGDDLLDLGRPALTDLHGGLDRVGVIGVEVLLSAPVEPAARGIDSLLDGGVRDLFDEDANLQLVPPNPMRTGALYPVD